MSRPGEQRGAGPRATTPVEPEEPDDVDFDQNVAGHRLRHALPRIRRSTDGETDLHVAAILHLYDALRRRFRRRQDVHVAADLFLYYFDPEKSNRRSRLKGFRLRGRKFTTLELDSGRRLTSRELGLVLGPDGHLLRLFDPRTQERILTGEEQEEEIEQARREADAQRRRAAALEAELDRLRAAQKRPDA